jgi:hypothetical protein
MIIVKKSKNKCCIVERASTRVMNPVLAEAMYVIIAHKEKVRENPTQLKICK